MHLVVEQFQDLLMQIRVAVAVLLVLFFVAEVWQTNCTTATAIDATTKALWKSFAKPTIIITILIGNAAVGVWQTQLASDSLAALKKLQATVTTIIRNHHTIGNLPTDQLIPGNMVKLHTGNKVPSNRWFVQLQSSVLAVDEGPLMAESVTVHKLPRDKGTTTATADTNSSTFR